MKPDGRALDIAVVGLGQAGGNLAAEFYRRGYRALAFNTAQTDLAALEPGGLFPSLPSDRRFYIGLDGYDGAGADPSYGKQCVTENSERIRTAVLKQVHDADAVLITAGLGGGTGSSISALIEILAEEDLPLLSLMTLPTEGESGIAKVNAVKAINEVVDAPLMGWIFVDNARIASLNPDISVVDYYAHINGQIAAPIDAFNRLNDSQNLHPIRSFDGEDYRKLLLSGGVLNYAVSELPDISTEEVVGTVRDNVEASDIMPSGFDLSRLSYLGMVIEAPEQHLANTPISVFEEIADQLKNETSGAAVYQGSYRCPDDRPITLRLIAATQSLPHRIREILADAKREGSALGEKIREELPTLELGEIESFDLFRTRSRPSDRGRRTRSAPPRIEGLDDLSLELGVGRKSRSQPAQPIQTPAPQAPPPPQPPTDVDRPARAERTERLSHSQVQAAAAKIAEEAKNGASTADLDDGDDSHRRRARPRPSPGKKTPQKSAAQTSEPQVRGRRPRIERRSDTPPELGTEEIDVVAQLAQLGDLAEDDDPELNETVAHAERPLPNLPGSGDPDLPKPESYDKLVAAYLSAKTARDRQEVVRQLETDSLSEHTVVRYYAVEAMAKLGRKIFGNALLTATEDSNEAVRTLAVEALKR